MTTLDLTPDEKAELDLKLDALYEHGYTAIDGHKDLKPGVRIRHRGHQYPQAYRDGTGYIAAVTQKSPSGWSESWGMPDVEVVVVWDKPTFEGQSRLAVLGHYHVEAVAG